MVGLGCLPFRVVPLPEVLARLASVVLGVSALLVAAFVAVEIGRRPRRRRAGRQKDQVGIAVEDTGVGIPPEELGQIRDPFYQVESPCVVATPGRGWGRPSCGAWSSRAAAPCGPRARAGTGAAGSTSPCWWPRPPRRRRCPRVSDNRDTSLLLADLLEGEGYHVESVSRGEPAP